MGRFIELFRAGANYQITNAQCFSKDVMFLCIEVSGDDDDDDDDEGAGAIVRVDLRDFSAEILLEIAGDVLNARSLDADTHFVLMSGGYLHRLAGGEHEVFPYASMSYLTGLAAVSPTVLAEFGDDGEMYLFENGSASKVPCGTDERLFHASFLRPDLAFVVGNYGALLQGGVEGFKPVKLAKNAFEVAGEPGSKHQLVAVLTKADGFVLIGSHEGPAYMWRDGSLVKLEGLEPGETVNAIATFQGVDYFGGDQYGIYRREEDRLVPTFPTGGGMLLHTSEAGLTITAGHYAYFFDGDAWTELMITPGTLVERVPLDFTPGVP